MTKIQCIVYVLLLFITCLKKKCSPVRRMRAGRSVRLSVRSGGRDNGVGEISFKHKYHRLNRGSRAVLVDPDYLGPDADLNK